MDTYGDKDREKFSESLSLLMKEGGKTTWWNSMTGSDNYYGISEVTYDVYDVTPPTNNYFNYSQYYLPKKQF